MKATIPLTNAILRLSLLLLLTSCGGDAGEGDVSTDETNSITSENSTLEDLPITVDNEEALLACLAEGDALEASNHQLTSEISSLRAENEMFRGEISALTSGTQPVNTSSVGQTETSPEQGQPEYTGPDYTGITPPCDDANFRIRMNVTIGRVLNNGRNASDYIAGDSEADIQTKVGEPDRIRSTNSGAFYQFEYEGGSVRFYGAIYDSIAPHIVGTVFDWQIASCP